MRRVDAKMYEIWSSTFVFFIARMSRVVVVNDTDRRQAVVKGIQANRAKCLQSICLG